MLFFYDTRLHYGHFPFLNISMITIRCWNNSHRGAMDLPAPVHPQLMKFPFTLIDHAQLKFSTKSAHLSASLFRICIHRVLTSIFIILRYVTISHITPHKTLFVSFITLSFIIIHSYPFLLIIWPFSCLLYLCGKCAVRRACRPFRQYCYNTHTHDWNLLLLLPM